MQPQTILLTGSSSGFGLTMARMFLEKSYSVLATMRDIAGKNAPAAKKLKSFAGDTTGTLHLLELDVTRDDSVNEAIQYALDLEGKIDVAINNAGVGVSGFAEAVTPEQFQKQFEVNVFGAQRVNRAVLPSMRARGSGLLVHISSVMGRIVLPFAAPYTASKFALEGLAESYRYELLGTGVDCVIVEPGGFPTSFFANMIAAGDKDRIESYGDLRDTPEKMWSGVGQMLQSDEAPDPRLVAEAVLNLVETPAGKRPLRTVVDPMMGGEAPSAINQLTDDIQKQLLTSLGIHGTANGGNRL